jgi:hypothetical protein
MAEIGLHIRPQGGSWSISDSPHGSIIHNTPNRDAAVQYATQHLRRFGGGSYVLYGISGHATDKVKVGGQSSHNPLLAGYDDKTSGRVNELAEILDGALGRQEKDSPLGKLGDENPDSILSARITGSQAYKEGKQGVAWSGFALAAVGLFGTGTFSSATAAFAKAAQNSPTFDSYLTFGQAFWATFPWSISAAIGIFLVLTRLAASNPQGFGIAWVAGSSLLSVICTSIGISGPTWQEIYYYTTHAGSSPLHKIGGLLQAYFIFFGPIPFLGGLITGTAVGWFLSNRVEKV